MVNFINFIPEGVEDTHSNQYEIKENVTNKIKSLFKSFGYRQILTPSFEYYDLFSRLKGAIDKDEMFKIIDGMGKILVLRPDVTIPIARMAATSYKNYRGYLKFCYATSIFRINNEQNGQKREFIQAGAEYLGNSNPDSDAEVISLGIEALKKCRINNFKFDLGQIGFFKGFVKELRISEDEEELITKLIENKSFTELNEFLKDLNVSERQKEIINKMPYLYGKPEDVIKAAEELILNEDMMNALNNIKSVCSILDDYGYKECIAVDLGLINHLHYYTGIIFKGYVNNHGKEVISGGRYDNLTKEYGYYMPATGFGLNIDELMEVIDPGSLGGDEVCYTDYLILYSDEWRKKALTLAKELRERGYIVECDIAGDIESHMKNAEQRNVKKAILITEESISLVYINSGEIEKMLPLQFLKSLDSMETSSPIH